jgi:hypothetical protein
VPPCGERLRAQSPEATLPLLPCSRLARPPFTARGMHINDMKMDFKDGLLLINLMEVISDKKINNGRHNKHPRIISQKMENLNLALDFIKAEGIKLVNVGADDIASGNIRSVGAPWLAWRCLLTRRPAASFSA